MKTKLIVILSFLIFLQSCSHNLVVLQPKELNDVKISSKTIEEYTMDNGSLVKVDRKVNEGIEYSKGEWSTTGTYLKAVDQASNKEIWRFPVEADLLTDPVFDETRIFFGTSLGMYYALDKKTGSIAWSYKAPIDIFNFNIMYKKTVIFRDYSSKIYCLDSDTGNLIWTFDLSSLFGKDYTIFRGPIFNAGVIFFALNRNMILGISANTGKELWREDLEFFDGDEFYLQNGFILLIQNMKYKTVGEGTPREDTYNFKDVLTNENNYVNLCCFDLKSGRKLWTNKVVELDEQNFGEQINTKSAPIWSNATNLRYELPPIFTKQTIFFNDRFLALHGFNSKTGKKDIVIDLLPYRIYRKFYAPTIQVVDNDAYFLGEDPLSGETLLNAINLKNGKLLWKKQIEKHKEAEFKIDGASIFLTLSGRLIVLNRKNGDETLHVRIPFNYNLSEIHKESLVITRTDPSEKDSEYAFTIKWKNK